MRFVDDVDLESRFVRKGKDTFVQSANIVDACLRGGIHLDQVVHRGTDGTGQNAGHGSFARTARTGEEVRVRDVAELYRSFKHFHNMLLANNFFEFFRPIFAIEHAAHFLSLFHESQYIKKRPPLWLAARDICLV